MSQAEILFLPSTEKCFTDEKITDKVGIESLSMLKNERLAFEVAYTATGAVPENAEYWLDVDSPLKEYIRVCRIEQMPIVFPVYTDRKDDNYLRVKPGLFPDLLLPFEDFRRLVFVRDQLRALYITVENQKGIAPGTYPVTVRVRAPGTILTEKTLTVTVIDAVLPEGKLLYTNWMHYDCIANYYGVKVFSRRFWSLTEKYIAAAVYEGQNMLLTPVFTPPLDTQIGGERTTVQLVDVSVSGGKYSFGYRNFDRFVKIAKKCGIRVFEISHLFTQWGCLHAPKIVACVDGENKRIFGWETDSHGEEYVAFLRAFLTDFTAHLREIGIADQCWFHISDEPNTAQIESYTSAKDSILDLIEGFPRLDALSHYEFYESGAVQHPVASIDHIEPFLENKVPGLWGYICCGQVVDVPNRLIAMPGARTRILGTMLYKYDLMGFLQWGFNFYGGVNSRFPINPYHEFSGDYAWPAGDPFAVYPAPDGTYRSLHGALFSEALQDLRALRLCESLIGREETLRLLEEDAAEPITFRRYPKEQGYLLALREKINRAIGKAVHG